MSGWFAEARLGLFVHFGLYSGAARHEWVQTYERLTDDEYRVYFDHFEPDRFDARSIARAARLAGAGYVVLTTKHHEGFALWDTALSDFSAPRACGRDLVRETVQAKLEQDEFLASDRALPARELLRKVGPLDSP